MSNYEIEKTLVLSTGHIPESEGDLLEEAGNTEETTPRVEHVVYNYTYGWRVRVPLDDFEGCIDALDSVPFTQKLVRLAHSLDCQWLRLDQDGFLHDHLPQQPFSYLEQLAGCAE